MASNTVVEISRLDLSDPDAPPVASITDVKNLSSYNWIEAPTPTIAVPGSPPLWSAPSAPKQLKKDSGLVYIAQNAARHPESPLEPLFRALYIANPSFDIRSIDVVTDRNNIRKLLAFIDSGSTGDKLEAFTIHIEVTKNTAILCREETLTRDFIGQHDFRGFGREFEKAYTTSQVNGSTGHHRIISYRFSELNFIIRHEADGYVETGTSISSSNNKKLEDDRLSSLLGSLSLSSNKTSFFSTPAESKLIIRDEGQVVSIESTLEIKTRVMHKPLEIQEAAPQLWISQTLKLVRAYHQKGVFQPPVVEDVAALIKEWEERNQTNLRKLAVLIRKIVMAVKAVGGNAMVKYDVTKDKLIVSKVDKKSMLPKDLYSKWDDKEADTNTEHDSEAATVVRSIDESETKTKEKCAVPGKKPWRIKKIAAVAKEGKWILWSGSSKSSKRKSDLLLDSQGLSWILHVLRLGGLDNIDENDNDCITLSMKTTVIKDLSNMKSHSSCHGNKCHAM